MQRYQNRSYINTSKTIQSTLKVRNIHSHGNLYSLSETGQYRQYAATHDQQHLLLERPWRIIETIAETME